MKKSTKLDFLKDDWKSTKVVGKTSTPDKDVIYLERRQACLTKPFPSKFDQGHQKSKRSNPSDVQKFGVKHKIIRCSWSLMRAQWTFKHFSILDTKSSIFYGNTIKVFAQKRRKYYRGSSSFIYLFLHLIDETLVNTYNITFWKLKNWMSSLICLSNISFLWCLDIKFTYWCWILFSWFAFSNFVFV